MRPIRFQILLEGNGIIMLLVCRTIHERHRAVTHMLHELFDRLGIIVEFPEIAVAELGPFRWIVAEPLPEGGARSDLLEPEIDPGRTLGHAPRPESVHKNPECIA